MKKENLKPAIELDKKIEEVEKERRILSRAIRLRNVQLDYVDERNNQDYGTVSRRFFNFNVIITLALEEINKELSELKAQFEAL